MASQIYSSGSVDPESELTRFIAFQGIVKELDALLKYYLPFTNGIVFYYDGITYQYIKLIDDLFLLDLVNFPKDFIKKPTKPLELVSDLVRYGVYEIFNIDDGEFTIEEAISSPTSVLVKKLSLLDGDPFNKTILYFKFRINDNQQYTSRKEAFLIEKASSSFVLLKRIVSKDKQFYNSINAEAARYFKQMIIAEKHVKAFAKIIPKLDNVFKSLEFELNDFNRSPKPLKKGRVVRFRSLQSSFELLFISFKELKQNLKATLEITNFTQAEVHSIVSYFFDNATILETEKRIDGSLHSVFFEFLKDRKEQTYSVFGAKGYLPPEMIEYEFDFFALLEISRFAPRDDIKKAFKRARGRFHPDRPTEYASESKFKFIVEKYNDWERGFPV
jgi:hypothetical protein